MAAASAAVVGAESGRAAETIDVRGDSAHYSNDGKHAEFDGNVVVQTKRATLYADALSVNAREEGNRYRLHGKPARAVCDSCGDARVQLQAATIVFRADEKMYLLDGGITLCAGDDSCSQGKLQADSGEWRQAEGRAFVRGMPVRGHWRLEDGGDSPVEFRANELDYDSASGDIVMRGDALLSRGGDEIRGAEVRLNARTGALSATGGGGRVRGTFGGGGDE